jgi:hypothetical protein
MMTTLLAMAAPTPLVASVADVRLNAVCQTAGTGM